MDSFMDKLAQKLTAQEMIRANSAADAEEMKKLKCQIKEYRDILDRLQQMVDEGSAKLHQIQAVSSDNEELQTALEQLKQSVELKVNRLNENLDQMDESIGLQLSSMSESWKQLDESIGLQLSSMSENWNQLEQTIDGKIIAVGDNVHKECVKVYRNVQAVVVEENGKQSENIVAEIKGLKGKLGAVLGVSIAALILSGAGIAFQVLVYFHVI